MIDLVEYSYFGLFCAAFLAATILPFSSEVLLSALMLQGLNENLLLASATAGNVLGSCTNYALGIWGGVYAIKKFLKVSDDTLNKAEARFQNWGYVSLLFAWVPVIGDPLTVIAGLLRVNFFVFLVLVGIGKFARYWAVMYLVS